MGRGTGASGKEEVSEEAGGGGMGVLYVERGMGKVGGAKVGVELEAAGGDLKAGADEAKLAKGGVKGAGGGGGGTGYVACDEAAGNRMAGKGAGGGDIGGGGGEGAGAFIGFHLTTKGFGGEKGAVGGSGAGVAEGLEPKGNERERVGGEGEERAA